MKELAETAAPDRLTARLLPLVDDYEAWIDGIARDAAAGDIASDAQLKEAAEENIRRCREAASRMRSGIDLIGRERRAFEAFRFANRAMWDQRVHSLWAAANRKVGRLEGAAAAFDRPENRTWRPSSLASS
jgi:hypothetical protein